MRTSAVKSKVHAPRPASQPRSVPYQPSPCEGFIPHPTAAPVSFRLRRPAWWPRRRAPEPEAAVGILFRVERYVAPGSLIEVAFGFRGAVHSFLGEVVLVRELASGFEVGLWVADATAAARARQVERQFQMDTYLRERRLREGPYLSRETVARDWLPEFAGAARR